MGISVLPPPDPALSDGLVTVRPPRPDDAEAIHLACQDPEIAKWTLVPSPYTLRDAEAFIELTERGWESGAPLSFVIVDEDDEAIGSIGVKRFAHDPSVGDIGYWLARDSRGRGIATRALILVSRWVIPAAGLVRLQLYAHVGNTASRRVAQNAGFRSEGIFRRSTRSGRVLEFAQYSLLPGEE